MAPYVLFCGLTMAVSWGIRGQFGHERGAMIPGVTCALAIALVSIDDAKRTRLAALGVAGGLGMAVGGVMSYGSLVEMLLEPSTFWRGLAGLAAKGAIWGGIAGGALGMALSETRYRWRNLLWLLPLLAFWHITGNTPSLDGLSEGDMSVTLAATLALFLLWLYAVPRDTSAAFMAMCGLVGFGVGMPFGYWLFAVCRGAGLMDWWKVAEVVWGFCGGAALGLGVYCLDEARTSPPHSPWRAPTWLGLIYIAWLVPLANALNVLTYWTLEKEVLGPWALALYGVGALVLLVGLATLFECWPNRLSPRRTAALLFVWVGLVTFAAQFLKMRFPNTITGPHVCTQIVLGLGVAGLCAWALWLGLWSLKARDGAIVERDHGRLPSEGAET